MSDDDSIKFPSPVGHYVCLKELMSSADGYILYEIVSVGPLAFTGSLFELSFLEKILKFFGKKIIKNKKYSVGEWCYFKNTDHTNFDEQIASDLAYGALQKFTYRDHPIIMAMDFTVCRRNQLLYGVNIKINEKQT